MKISTNKKEEYTEIILENKTGLYISLISLGAGIREIRVPDKNKLSKTVTLCPVDEKIYLNSYHGKTVGRTAGRIAGATFTINGKTAVLDKNNFNADNLHGGKNGLHIAKFTSEIRQENDFTDVIFRYNSPDGEGGYFGNIKIKVTYRICENQNKFSIIFDGKPDTETLLNLTNHVYLNMSGNLEEKINNQLLYINAPKYGKLNERLISEEIVPVTKEMDFNNPRKIGDYIYAECVQQYTKGYDHPYVLAPHTLSDLVCSLQSELSGIRLEIRTTYPCLVFYANGKANGSVEVYRGKFDEQYLAACFECQYLPDGIHKTPENCGIISAQKPYHEVVEYLFKTL